MAVKNYGPDTNVCSVTLTSEIWHWVKVMTHPWVTVNNCLKYYPDLRSSEELWPAHRFWVCIQYDLNLGDMTLGMTLGQGHISCTFLGQGQQFCEILSRSDQGVRSYGQEMM